MEKLSENGNSLDAARRDFLAKCGKLAVVTPPAVTLMLAASQRHYAVAQSGGAHQPVHNPAGPRQGNNGFGNGGSDGVPGNSGNNPSPQAPSKSQDQAR